MVACVRVASEAGTRKPVPICPTYLLMCTPTTFGAGLLLAAALLLPCPLDRLLPVLGCGWLGSVR